MQKTIIRICITVSCKRRNHRARSHCTVVPLGGAGRHGERRTQALDPERMKGDAVVVLEEVDDSEERKSHLGAHWAHKGVADRAVQVKEAEPVYVNLQETGIDYEWKLNIRN